MPGNGSRSWTIGIELHGLPGLLRRIRPGDGVDTATRSILLEDPLPAGLFPVDAQGRTTAERHTRIRRWDQSGLVRRADGTTFQDLNASASSDGILIPAAGVQLRWRTAYWSTSPWRRAANSRWGTTGSSPRGWPTAASSN